MQDSLTRAVVQLRDALFDLHPPQLEQLGLEVALRSLASEVGGRSGLHVSVEVDQYTSGVHDQLLYSLTRELLSNAERQAAATEVVVCVRRDRK